MLQPRGPDGPEFGGWPCAVGLCVLRGYKWCAEGAWCGFRPSPNVERSNAI